jgi:hypothetical protein
MKTAPMLRFMLASATALALFAVRVDAQTVTRWTLTWTDDTYRYVNGERVPVGEQSALLSVMPTRGDSVVATLPTANPAIVDTLDGTMTAQRLVLRSRVREATAQGPSSSPAGGFRFSMQLELALTGDRGTGTRRRLITGPPGIEVPEPPPTRITAERAP